jgi:DNA (cytosine-5)-methyltransferase 1
VVVAENVPGALSGAHKIYWENLHHRMRALGYQTQDLLLDSSNFGVAQIRRRILMIAWLKKSHSRFEVETQPKRTLGDVLLDLDGVANHSPNFIEVNSNDHRIAIRILQGQKLTNSRSGSRSVHTWDIPEVFGKTTIKEREILGNVLKLRRQSRRRETGDADPVCTSFLNKSYGIEAVAKLVKKGFLREIGMYHDLTNTFNGKYRRLTLDAPSRTVDTRFGDHRLFLHPLEHRAFTVREAARVQGFPDDFIFAGTQKQQFRMVGNAVPPPLAKSVANYIKTFL